MYKHSQRRNYRGVRECQDPRKILGSFGHPYEILRETTPCCFLNRIKLFCMGNESPEITLASCRVPELRHLASRHASSCASPATPCNKTFGPGSGTPQPSDRLGGGCWGRDGRRPRLTHLDPDVLCLPPPWCIQSFKAK